MPSQSRRFHPMTFHTLSSAIEHVKIIL